MAMVTTSKKRLLKGIIAALAVLVGAGVIIMAVMNSFKVVAAEKKLPIYSVSRTDNKIAVTFDCAWGNSNTDSILAELKDAGATATFFVTGEFCDSYPEDVKKIYDAGHEIGNHSDKHPHLDGINVNDLIADTRECSRKIKMITGEEPKVYRAPYGEYDDKAVSTIEGMGLKMIQWSVDSIDWQEPDTDTIIKRIEEGTVSGSILLFHNDLKNTEEALPQLLLKLKQKGFQSVKASDLVYYDSYHIDGNGMQIYDISALLPAVKYSDNRLLDETMEIFRQNMTLEELYQLTGGATPELLSKTAPLLDEVHLKAIEEASFEELKEAVENLIAVAEQEGAGENAAARDGQDAAAASSPSTETTASVVNQTPYQTETATGYDMLDPDSYIKGAAETADPVTAAPQTTPAETTAAETAAAETTAAETIGARIGESTTEPIK
ncbi:MAG: polysaccharide deacetylase family protein [Firmicutes bacterium]|nr:polysaccharide deacetylase family protein [Bacillota bacterium]